MAARIPVASTDLGGNEERYVVDAIRSSWISSTGPYLARFEREYADACGTSGAVAVCNGTVALHLALLGLDVRPGDEVLVPSLTYVATANAVRYVGAEPVFVDVDRETWCIDPAQIEAAITRRTKGIIAVHLLGHPADMDRINHIAAVNGLWVVEDAAEAPLATYKGRVVGGLAKMATFSFFGNKLHHLRRRRRDHAERPAARKAPAHPPRSGHGPAAPLLFPRNRIQFPPDQRGRRHSLRTAGTARGDRRAPLRHLRPLQGIALADPRRRLPAGRPVGRLSPWMFTATVDADEFGCTRDELAAALAERDIETRPLFHPLHKLPPFREESQRRGERLPVTDDLAASAIMLPTYNRLTDADLVRIAGAVADVRKGRMKRSAAAA